MMGKLLYNIFIFLYPLGIRIAALFNDKAKLWINGRKYQTIQDITGSPVWVHCASLGEFEQARPVIEKIKKDCPETKILLTFFSPSGYEYRKNYRYADWVKYLPMDGRRTAENFLRQVNPSIVFFVKYEYWFYYLREISKRSVPLVLISGIFRSDQPFFKWYGGLYRKMLSFFSFFFLQNTDSQNQLNQLGFQNAMVAGDTRFDRVAQVAEEASSSSKVEQFLSGSQAVIVAGSTWPEDDKVLSHLANANPGIKFIVAPHNIDEGRLAETALLYKRSVRYSAFTPGKSDAANVLVVDNVGMLSSLYRYGKICFIGGGFGSDGVHNVLEAAVYGRPLIHGPEYRKYAEAVQLVVLGASFEVNTALDVEETVFDFLNNRQKYDAAAIAAHRYVQENKGASDEIVRWLYKKRLLIK